MLLTVQEREQKLESESLTSGQAAHAAAASELYCQSAEASAPSGGGIG